MFMPCDSGSKCARGVTLADRAPWVAGCPITCRRFSASSVGHGPTGRPRKLQTFSDISCATYNLCNLQRFKTAPQATPRYRARCNEVYCR